jgi:hypothetical protein
MKDYVIIHIKEMSQTDIQVIMNNAIQKIKKETSLFTFIVNFNYYLIFSYFSFLFNHTFLINKVIFNFKETSYLIKNNLLLIVTDKGIKIQNNFIPYENITKYGNNDNQFFINIFGIIDFQNEKLKFSLGNGNLTIAFDSTNPCKLINLIRKNMNYHIRYNKINTEVISWYSTNTP